MVRRTKEEEDDCYGLCRDHHSFPRLRRLPTEELTPKGRIAFSWGLELEGRGKPALQILVTDTSNLYFCYHHLRLLQV